MGEKIIVSRDGGSLEAVQVEENFSDLHSPLSRAQAMVESARCLFCFDAPCIRACPTSIDIPKFIHQIRTDNLIGSAKTILSSNIMGGTCARVCPTEILCEGDCVKNASGEEPIRIGHLQRYAVDHFLGAKRPHPFKRAEVLGTKIAVIGAGPAGLACAHRAAMLGHDVRVFEARPKSGGLNEYGLAAYKMVNDFAQAETEFLLEIGGITVEHGKALGRDLELSDLRQNFDAVFIGVGLGDVRSLDIPGEDLAGVRDAVEFIAELRQAPRKSAVTVPDDVLVIGGGNTAIDAAVQSKRLGAARVTLVYRRGEFQMPATEWERNLAKTNDVQVLYWARPSEILSAKTGELSAAVFERTRLDEGEVRGTGERFELPAKLVLKAVGQVLDDSSLSGLEIRRGKLKTDESFRTGLPGVYAGGDCVGSGEDLTVQAVEDGLRAAEAIDFYIREEM